MSVFVRLQSFRPVSSKECRVTPATPCEVSKVKWVADSCTAAHLEEFFQWEPGQVNVWPRETPPRNATVYVVECHYNARYGTYSMCFWREESVNNNK